MMNLVLGILFVALGLALFAPKLDRRTSIGLGVWVLVSALYYYWKH